MSPCDEYYNLTPHLVNPAGKMARLFEYASDEEEEEIREETEGDDSSDVDDGDTDSEQVGVVNVGVGGNELGLSLIHI